MGKKISTIQVFTLLAILILGNACNETVKKDFPKEKKLPSFFNSLRNCNVSRFMQDKSGNLWFGTTDNGLYKYDGKSFKQFTINDGLDCNKIYCILEDKDGKIWVGTEVGLCLYNRKTFSKIQIPLPKNLPPNKNPYYQTHWVYNMLQAKDGKPAGDRCVAAGCCSAAPAVHRGAHAAEEAASDHSGHRRVPHRAPGIHAGRDDAFAQALQVAA